MTTATTPSRTRRHAAAGPVQATPAQSCVGLVTACAADRFSVTSGGLRASGRRAASCLLEPAVGDTVACLLVAPDEVWVLAVLQREEGVANVLRCEGPLTLAAPELALETGAFSLRAAQARVTTDDAQFIGKNLHVIGTAVKVVGSVLSTVFERVSHFSRNHLRTTEGIDRVHATHVECEADQLARISGQHLLLNGQDLVKARGSQIHFG
ncbi:DUF3540 domain-containing protein [Variovorax sp. RT4R15]|uniref:DUF3540 domain-containing protein n=1 Tax=Variovorax sp. RT4R15 TaxID=3443737 RepID=UPI003F460F38